MMRHLYPVLKWVVLAIAGVCVFLLPEIAHAQTDPVLTIANQVPATPGGTVTVPITFTSNGNSITSFAFSINFDETWLSIDPTDSAGKGYPDAIVPNLPANFSIVNLTFDPNASNAEIEFGATSFSGPVLPNNRVVLRITFTVGSPPSSHGPTRSTARTTRWSR